MLAIDYGKAPEHPFPYALEECYDVYRALQESRGKVIGMSGSDKFCILLSGDSAGGNLACGMTLKILEYPQPHIKSAYARKAAGGPGSQPPPLAKPIGLLLAYPSLNFGYTSWMRPDFLRVLRQQSELNLHSMGTPAQTTEIPRNMGLLTKGSSPLNPSTGGVSASRRSSAAALSRRPTSAERRASASVALPATTGKGKKSGGTSGKSSGAGKLKTDRSFSSLAAQAEMHLAERARFAEAEPATSDDQPTSDDESPEETSQKAVGQVWTRIEGDDLEVDHAARSGMHRSPSMDVARKEHQERQLQLQKLQEDESNDRLSSAAKRAPINTRLTMTSMAGYFQDRIITQSMLRAMAILYIGPRKQPDFDNDYLLSPILAPPHLLAQFPPTIIICGEKDPLCECDRAS